MSLVIDLTVRTPLVVLGALGIASLLVRSSAALRHWVLTLGVACAAATPLLQAVLPAWDIGPFAVSRPAALAPQQASVSTGVLVHARAVAADPDDQASAPPMDPGGSSRLVWMMTWIWLTGALVSVSTVLVGLYRLSRAAAAATPVKAPHLLAIAADAREAVGLRRHVTLLHSGHPSLLLTWGALRPRIILPSDAPRWPEARARVVLRHEFAHVARGDWLSQMSAELLRTVYWFNPLFWIACRRMRAEGERACDDAVLKAGIQPIDYAVHLLELARESAGEGATPPALAMARRSSLEGRVKAMLNNRINRRPLTRRARLAALLVLAMISVPIAVAQDRFSTLAGTVVDQTNRAIPGATLVLANADTQAKYEVRTDRTGRFEFVGLPAAEYQLAVNQPGLKTYKETVSLSGEQASRRIQLEIGSVHETIVVTPDRDRSLTPENPEREAEKRQSRQVARAQGQLAYDRSCGGGTADADMGGRVLPPRKLTHLVPDYPQSLRAAGIAGVVTLDALIATDGMVRNVTVVSSPHPELARLATEAVRQWEFSPTFLNCTPIEVSMRVELHFAR